MKRWAVVLLFLLGCVPKAPPLDRTLRLGWESLPRSVDSRYAVDADSQHLGGLVHCSLIRFDVSGKPNNQLAEKMEWIDAKHLKIRVRSDLKFWDGSQVTAEDVQATYAFFLTPEGELSPLKHAFRDLEKVEVLDAATLLFSLKNPDSDLVENLSLGILPKRLALGKEIFNPHDLVGCGLFRIDRWEPSLVQLKRAWPSSKDVKFIRFEIVRDENTRFLKLRNNEIDLVQNNLSQDVLKDLPKFPHLKFLKGTASSSVTYLAFQIEDPVLKKRGVREAIALAIDRQKIVDHILGGGAQLANTVLAPTHPDYWKGLRETPFDPARSEQLLAEAGLPWDRNPEHPRFSFKLRTTSKPFRLLIARTIAEDLAKVGISLQIEGSDWGKFKKDVDEGVAQSWILLWIGFKGPSVYSYLFHSKSFPPGGANRGHYSNPKLDHFLDLGKKSIEEPIRKKAYKEAQKILAHDFPYVFLWHDQQFAVIHERVKGYEIYGDGSLYSLSDVELSSSKASRTLQH